MYFEEVNTTDDRKYAARSQLMLPSEEDRLQQLNKEMGVLMERMFDMDSNTLHIFYILNHRIDLMAWLLESLIIYEDPSMKNDYKFRIRENKKQKLPLSKEKSKIGNLIDGINHQVEAHISELIESVENSIENKIFLFPRKPLPLFDWKDFVTNLDQVSDQGIIPAQVLVLMIEKLNLWEAVFSRLKQSCEMISDPDNWQVQKVNLSAGGFKVHTRACYPKFAVLNVFMDLDDHILICRGKMVSCKPVDDEMNALSIDFDFLSYEHSRRITFFIQKKELEEAMQLNLSLLG